jgi:hypothetical protein
VTDRVELLEERVAALAAAVSALEGRLAGLERDRGADPSREGSPESGAVAVADEEGASTGLAGAGPMVLAGRAFLGVGGAYLVRALTEAGTLPHLGGVLLGLAYAGAWAFAADRSGRAGKRSDATLHGLLALAVALPLLWEATVRMNVLPPGLAAALLVASGVAAFAVAWRRDLASVAWAATLGTVGLAWGLLLATTRIELFTLVLVGVGAGTLWTTYGRRWHGLRWPAALAADLAVLALVSLAGRAGGPPAAYAGLTAARGVVLALLLFVVYAGSFAARTLARRRVVNAFEVVQTVAVLVVGYGGAVRLAHAAGTGEEALGVAALALSGLAYGAAFGFVSRESSSGRNFVFFATLALVLALTGGALLAGGSALALVWTTFGLAASLLGRRFGRLSLAAHGAAYLAAAAVPSGLLVAAASAFRNAPAGAPVYLGPAPAAVALVAAFSWWVARGSPSGPVVSPGASFSRALLVLVSALGAGAAAVEALRAVLPPPASAPVGTVVLAAAAVGLAALRARLGAEETGWLAWAVLAAAAIRLLVHDLPGGRPAALFTSFVIYGLALLAVARLGKRIVAPVA